MPAATQRSGGTCGAQQLAETAGQRGRPAGGVVVADQRAPAVGQQAIAHLHLEVHAEARALDVARADGRREDLVVVARRAVVDMALREDQAEVVGRRRVVVGRDRPQVLDPRRLEEAQELDVVQMPHGIEVAEADALLVNEHRPDPRRARPRVVSYWLSPAGGGPPGAPGGGPSAPGGGGPGGPWWSPSWSPSPHGPGGRQLESAAKTNVPSDELATWTKSPSLRSPTADLAPLRMTVAPSGTVTVTSL